MKRYNNIDEVPKDITDKEVWICIALEQVNLWRDYLDNQYESDGDMNLKYWQGVYDMCHKIRKGEATIKNI